MQSSTNNRSRRHSVKTLLILNLSSASSCTILIRPLNTPLSQRISTLNYLGSNDTCYGMKLLPKSQDVSFRFRFDTLPVR